MEIIAFNISPPNKPNDLFDIQGINIETKESINLNSFRDLIKFMPAGNLNNSLTGIPILSVGKIEKDHEYWHSIIFSFLSDQIDVFGRTGLVYSSGIMSKNKIDLFDFINSIDMKEYSDTLINLKYSKINTNSLFEMNNSTSMLIRKTEYYKSNIENECLEWIKFVLTLFSKKDIVATSLTLFYMKKYHFQVIYDEINTHSQNSGCLLPFWKR